MSSLPTRTDVSGTPNNATAKLALAALFDFIAQRLAAGTSGAGTATASELASSRESLGVPMPNWLHNPDGAIAQRLSGAITDTNYGIDRWKVLTQTASVTPSQASNPEDGFRYAMRLTQSQASAQRMGHAQVIEGRDAVQLRGKTVTFGGRFKLSASANLRMAILAWTSTEDSVTADPVNDWTSGTYTGGNFFVSSNFTVVAVSQTALTAATAANASVSGAIPSGTNNIVVLYWTEATAAQNVTLDAWGVRLVEGSTLLEYIRRSFVQELEICQRYFEKSYDLATAPSTATLLGAVMNRSPSSENTVMVVYKVRKRTIPTVVLYSTQGGGAGTFYNVSTAGNLAHSVNRAGEVGFCAIGSLSDQHLVEGHWTAAADL